MGILQNTTVYLCGQIEHDERAGQWRHEIATRLLDIEPTITVWDPMVKPQWVGLARNDEIAFGWKAELLGGDVHRAAQCLVANCEVRDLCKQLASKCDWMIARLSKLFTWGSIDELEIAAARNIPVFLWMRNCWTAVRRLVG